MNDKSALETRYDKIDWNGLFGDVRSSFDYLRLAWQASERDLPPDLHRKAVDDLYFPTLELLAEFCACVRVTDETEPNK